MRESDVIRVLKEAAEARSTGSNVRLGIGDDAAVLAVEPGMEWVLTQDALVEDIHFRRAWTDPVSLGWKAMAVSLSDLAAMGARPVAAFLTLALPEGLPSAFITELAMGVARCLKRGGAASLAGGDTVRSPDRLFLDSVLVGTVPAGRAVLRHTAKAGDHLVVTGSIGGASLGLRLLEDPGALRDPDVRGRTGSDGTDGILQAVSRLTRRQLRPVPRVRAGSALSRRASAMADLSDGLAGAVHALCDASGLGVEVHARRLPVDPAVQKLAPLLQLDPEAVALSGGEDYELLAAVSPDALAHMPRTFGGLMWTDVGILTEPEKGRWLVREQRRIPLTAGYDAFSEG